VVLTVVVSVACVLLCVAAHLGVLLTMSSVTVRVRSLHQTTVGLIVLGALLGHLVEIALFGVGYTLLAPSGGGSGSDPFYHSAVSYTSLGDSQPVAVEWRLMTAVEALTGLVLITWTASFTFLVMQKHWAPDRENSSK
jgi:hypothetical protein